MIEYRKAGIATKLLNLVVEEAKGEECKEIILAATNMGRPIYEKYGFKNDADAMSYYII
ncbi:MAG: GNAT family N-acetyltransferase [Clostridium sp.]